MATQLLFPEFDRLKLKDFGGSLIKGNPREARPISVKRPMHLVLRSTLAKGKCSFLNARRAKQIRLIVENSARVQGIKIYRFANSGNHLHLIILARSRLAFSRFIRTITGLIARLTLGVERGKSMGIKFWDARPFTRILEWGRDFRRACEYLLQNTLEAFGFIPYQPRKISKLNRRKPPE
jgi:REP element-mobilizing transposase RayT